MDFVELQKSPDKITEFLSKFDHIITDCDGVIWHGSNAISGAVECINKFRELGKSVIFCTNNSSKTREEYMEKCTSLGFGGEPNDIVCVSNVTASYLKNKKFDEGNKKVFVLGMSALFHELDLLGIKHNEPEPNELPFSSNFTYRKVFSSMCEKMNDLNEYEGVVVGFDPFISYFKVCKAVNVLEMLKRKASEKCDDIIYVATNTDEQYPYSDDLKLPGTGSIVNFVSTAAENMTPTVMGKPFPTLFDFICEKHPSVDPSRTLMIGDRANTDILFGKNCGLHTLMVGSGCNSLQDMKNWTKDEKKYNLVADYYIDNLNDLYKLIITSNRKNVE